MTSVTIQIGGIVLDCEWSDAADCPVNVAGRVLKAEVLPPLTARDVRVEAAP